MNRIEVTLQLLVKDGETPGQVAEHIQAVIEDCRSDGWVAWQVEGVHAKQVDGEFEELS